MPQFLTCDNCGIWFSTSRNPQLLLEEVLRVYQVPAYLCAACFVNARGILRLKAVRNAVRDKSAARKLGG